MSYARKTLAYDMVLIYTLGSVITVQVLFVLTKEHVSWELLINTQVFELLTTVQSFPLFFAEQVF